MVAAFRIIPFVPSGPDFGRALAFFNEIGFETQWKNEGMAGLKLGGAPFLLQEIDIQAWAENQMLVVEVDDLDAYWAEIEAKDLPVKFSGVKTRPPTDFPWGREVHLIDPAGVCWHFRQGKP